MPPKASNKLLQRSALTEKKNALDQVQRSLKDWPEKSKQLGEDIALLESVTEGLYDETDKLAKKVPTEEVTDLQLEQINDAIAEVRRVCSTDAPIQKLRVFVPAGDNPQYRDAVLVLRQLRQGLTRTTEKLETNRRRYWNVQGKLELIEQAIIDLINGEQIQSTDYEEDEFKTIAELFSGTEPDINVQAVIDFDLGVAKAFID
jgi:seryl-tRNA synthetase